MTDVISIAKGAIEHHMQRCVDAWNRGNLKAFCDGYSRDATLITRKGLVTGRTKILEAYRASYGDPSDPSKMGKLKITLLEYRSISVNASAVFKWDLYNEKGSSHGLSLVTYILWIRGGGIEILQDASMKLDA